MAKPLPADLSEDQIAAILSATLSARDCPTAMRSSKTWPMPSTASSSVTAPSIGPSRMCSAAISDHPIPTGTPGANTGSPRRGLLGGGSVPRVRTSGWRSIASGSRAFRFGARVFVNAGSSCRAAGHRHPGAIPGLCLCADRIAMARDPAHAIRGPIDHERRAARTSPRPRPRRASWAPSAMA